MYTSTSFTTSVIIDPGSTYCRAGLSNDEKPTSFPNVIGKPKNKNNETAEVYIGNDAYNKRETLKISYPYEYRVCWNADDMTKIWQYIFDKILKVSPNEHPILLTQYMTFAKSEKENITQIMFEKFDVPALYIANPDVLSLYAHGLNTGIVVNGGYRETSSTPIYEGHMLFWNVLRPVRVGGSDLTEYLINLLNKRGYHFTVKDDFDVVDDIKKQLCYVALNYEDELAKTNNPTTYKLPDGQVINIGQERFQCPEVLFNLALIGEELGAVPEHLYNTIMKCDKHIRKEIYSNIMLDGDTMKITGLAERLKNEVTSFMSSPIEVNVFPSKYEYSAWLGGSILANSSVFPQKWITQEEYEEFGPTISHRKCF